MQILGLSESTPKPDNRIKSLFWPRVAYPEDVDYLGTQGFWICFVIAIFTAIVGVIRQSGASALDALYFYLAGVGIRNRSRFTAATALLIYFVGLIATFRIAHTGSVISIFFLALLVSNVRATWLAARWGERALQEPLVHTRQTLLEKFTDVVPRKIWPIGKWILYILTVLELFAICFLLFGGFPKPRST